MHIYIYVSFSLCSHSRATRETPGRHSGGTREASTIATRKTLWRHCGASTQGPEDTDRVHSVDARETPRATDPGPRRH